MAEEPPVQGTSARYIVSRLRRENKIDLAAAVEGGSISAFAAAVECGWTKRPPTLRSVTNQAHRRNFQLRAIAGAPPLDQLMEMWLGPSHNGSVFDSPEALRAAWETHRDEVMRLWGQHGRRPMAWWCFDAPGLGLMWPGYFRQQSYLFDAGVLEEPERVALLAFWRKEFERTYRPGFSHTAGPGEIFHGAAARRKHLDWADVPDSLRQQWTAERRRRPRAVRNLPAEVPEKAPVVAGGGEQEENAGLRPEPSAAAGTME